MEKVIYIIAIGFGSAEPVSLAYNSEANAEAAINRFREDGISTGRLFSVTRFEITDAGYIERKVIQEGKI